jgi:hypothetical protein
MRLRIAATVFLGLVSLAIARPFAQSPASPQQAQPPAAIQNGPELVALADQVANDVERLRGWTFKQPIKKEVTTIPATVEYLKQQVDETFPPSRALLVQGFLRTIGLLPPDADLRRMWVTLLENQVGGFYDTKTKSLHLVSRPGTPPVVERIVLAHELTHALDDQWADLDTFVKERSTQSEDVGLVAQSVVEGSATALMIQYTTRQVMSGKLQPAALQEYAKQEEERSKPFLDAPRYFSAMLASYICGTQFLAKGNMMALAMAPDDKAIGEALLAARNTPPQSTEQILHPEKYWSADKRDEPVTFDDDAAAKWLGRPGRWIVHRDTVGELLTAILLSAPGSKPDINVASSASWTNTGATGWGGDRFYLLSSGESADAARASLQDLKGVWVTAWDTAKDRDEFLEAIPGGQLARGAAPVAVGNLVALVYFGVDEAERATLTKGFQALPIPMTKSGKPWTDSASRR